MSQLLWNKNVGCLTLLYKNRTLFWIKSFLWCFHVWLFLIWYILYFLSILLVVIGWQFVRHIVEKRLVCLPTEGLDVPWPVEGFLQFYFLFLFFSSFVWGNKFSPLSFFLLFGGFNFIYNLFFTYFSYSSFWGMYVILFAKLGVYSSLEYSRAILGYILEISNFITCINMFVDLIYNQGEKHQSWQMWSIMPAFTPRRLVGPHL